MRFKVSLLQPNNSLILPNNHYVTNFYYNVPQDHYYSHKLSTFLFHLIATNSFFQNIEKAKTSFNFTPIIPLPTTEYDTIFTCMKNFQDVLQQRHLNYGPFWCYEGVYRTAKELKLLNPSLFANIFIGLGGFHTEKILISCCGSYLQECGIGSVFAENEIFGPEVVQSVLSGGH